MRPPWAVHPSALLGTLSLSKGEPPLQPGTPLNSLHAERDQPWVCERNAKPTVVKGPPWWGKSINRDFPLVLCGSPRLLLRCATGLQLLSHLLHSRRGF